MDLNTLSHAESLEYLTQIIGANRVNAEPEAAAEIFSLISSAAIAVSVAAAHIHSRPGDSLAEYAARLRKESSRLSPDNKAETAVFALCYQSLSEAHRRVFRYLTIHPGQDATVGSIAALVNLSPDDVFTIVEDLVKAHLIQQHIPGRYRLHDLARAYTQQQCASEDSDTIRRHALESVLNWYLHTAAHARMVLAPSRPLAIADSIPEIAHPVIFDNYHDALDWFEQERHNIMSAISVAHDNEFYTYAVRIPMVAFWFYFLRNYREDQATAYTIGLSSVRHLNSPVDHARMLIGLASAYKELARFDESITLYQQALSIRRDLGDRKGEAATLSDLGILYQRMGRFDEAIKCYQQALPVRRELNDRYGMGITLDNLGQAYHAVNQLNDAIKFYQESLILRYEVDDRFGQSTTLHNLGKTYLSLGDPNQALSYLDKALDICRNLDDQSGTAQTLIHIGQVRHMLGNLAKAKQHWNQALEIFETLDDPRVSVVQAHLAEIPKAT